MGRRAAYLPRLAAPHRAWLIADLVDRAGPVSPGDAALLAKALSGLLFWADETGLPDLPGVLLDGRTVDRYLTRGAPGLSPISARLYRTQLERTAAAVLPGPRPRRPALRLPRQGHLAGPRPYSPDDLGRLLAWADGQRSAHRRAGMTAAIALGAGAGLHGSETTRVQARDVRLLPDGTVTVHVPGPSPRTTVVRRDWEPLVLALAKEAGDGPLLPPGPQQQGRPPAPRLDKALQLNSAWTDPTAPGLVAKRLRATWLRAHLELGTRLDVLATAAGVDPNSVIVTHGMGLAPQAPADAARALRRADLPDGAVRRPPPRPVPPRGRPSTEAADVIARCRTRLDVRAHDFVIRALAAAAGPRSVTGARVAFAVAAALARWADRRGRPVTVRDLLDRDFLDAWSTAPDGAPTGTDRSRVPRLAAVDAMVAALRPDQALPSPADTGPYGTPCTRALHAWARAQPDPTVRARLLGLLGLGLGTGLRAGEHQHVTAGDIARNPRTGIVAVTVRGDRPREVVCQRRWEEALWAAARAAAGGLLLPPGTLPAFDPHGPGLIVAVPRTRGVPALTAGRCRLTWTAAHLASGTPLGTLREAAGNASDSMWAQAAAGLVLPPDVDAFRSLRGP